MTWHVKALTKNTNISTKSANWVLNRLAEFLVNFCKEGREKKLSSSGRAQSIFVFIEEFHGLKSMFQQLSAQILQQFHSAIILFYHLSCIMKLQVHLMSPRHCITLKWFRNKVARAKNSNLNQSIVQKFLLSRARIFRATKKVARKMHVDEFSIIFYAPHLPCCLISIKWNIYNQQSSPKRS